MSSIASFYLIRDADLPGLRKAAALSKGIVGTSRDGFWNYMEARGVPVVEFDGSGYIFGTLLSYLEDEHGISNTDSSGEFSQFIYEMRDESAFLLTPEYRRRYLSSFESGAFDETKLRAYFRKFNEVDEPDSGEWMRRGIEAIRAALGAVVDDSVVLVYIA